MEYPAIIESPTHFAERGPLQDKLDADALEWIETHGRKVALWMYRQNAEAAYQAVNAGLAERKTRTQPGLLATPLPAVGVDTRAANLLEKHLGITTVEGFLSTDAGELLTVPNFSYMQTFACMQALLKYAIERVMQLEAGG